MSEVGKVTIETVGRPTGVSHPVHATANVGGSLVEVSCESRSDPELAVLVDQLCAKLAAMALDLVQASLHDQGG